MIDFERSQLALSTKRWERSLKAQPKIHKDLRETSSPCGCG
ncbi:hypothetical protein [Fortiea sp. LEGE XX443]|nr:hypothetical protein [Fortiea sp. LEGE XX443]